VSVLAKFEVRSFTRSWDNRGHPKMGSQLGAHDPFSPKFLMGFVRMDPLNVSAKFEVRSFTHS